MEVNRKRVFVPVTRDFGLFLKKLRLERGLSQVEVANELGLKNQNICNWERGVSSPPFETFVALTKIYGVSEKFMLKKLMDEQTRLFTEEFKRLASE